MEEKQLTDRPIKDWLRKLKDAAYDVDDILDDCQTESYRLEYKAGGSISSSFKKVHTSFFTRLHPTTVLFRYKIGKRMKEITERLDEIAEERRKFHLREIINSTERHGEVRARRQTGSVITQPQLYGRENDKEKVIDYLVEKSSSRENLSIYTLLGMGGMGKTTLAQLVFNDERIIRHFDTRIWVCVSDEFDVKRLIKQIVESVTGMDCPNLDLDPLQKKLQEVLGMKRYLLVLDDVWNEDQEKWEQLKYVVACGSKGASIVVSTRLLKVAEIMSTYPPHRLNGLSEEDCWSLFRKRAFDENEEEPPNLVVIGKEIVHKCGGVPLAAKSLGSLMRFKRTEKEWIHVRDSELWKLPQDDTSILPALRLSYSNLPLHMRQCFAFCAVFPKDYTIEKGVLIQLWMANGFISSQEGDGLEMEEIGEEICKELFWRSFLQDAEKDEFGEETRFKMHDLVHDLAKYVMDDECLHFQIQSPNNLTRRVRHLFITDTMDICVSSKAKSVRTLLETKQLAKFPCNIRALRGRAYGFTTLPSSLVGNLEHLRYMDLSGTRIKTLPDTICQLGNLQTLKLDRCSNLEKLPEGMRSLRRLRHLHLRDCENLKQMPLYIRKLSSLRTLSVFVVDRRKGCQLDELQNLNIGGELSIKGLERVEGMEIAKAANLSRKQDLRSLTLTWSSDDEKMGNAEKVLEGLQPHPNLKYLRIVEYQGINFPHWLRNPILENIVEIDLYFCSKCVEFPSLGTLPYLRSLRVMGLRGVTYLDTQSHYAGIVETAFPSLQHLKIFDLPSLERLWKDELLVGQGRIFPCLSKLWIANCPKLIWQSCLSSVKNFIFWGNSVELTSFISSFDEPTYLYLDGNDKITCFPNQMIQNLSSLRSLTIDGYTRLEKLPLEMVRRLNALESLYIKNCEELECLWDIDSSSSSFQAGMPSLKSIYIHSCTKLKSLTQIFSSFIALEQCEISGCPELVDFPDGLSNLATFRHLTISGASGASGAYSDSHKSKLEVLSDNLQHITSLQYLHLNNLPNLGSLPEWIANFTSLQALYISRCPKLESLPTSFQNLTQLQTLDISRCPRLQKRCEEGTGEDWVKVAHVPHLHVASSSN